MNDQQLTDEQLLSIADDPVYKAKLTPEERGRLSQLQSQASNERQGGPVGRFVGNAVGPLMEAPGFMATVAQGFLPTEGGAQARQDIGKAILDPSVERLTMAAQANREGRPLAAAGNAVAAVPIVGPAIAHGIDQMRGGDVAGGAGTLTGIAAPFVAGPAMRGAGAVLKGTTAGEALANVMDASANRRMVDTIVPKVGPNKVRLGNKAKEVAPKLLRDPDLSAFSRSGLAEKISAKLDAATEGLDVASDARLVSQQVHTKPLLAAIDESIAALTAQPVDGSRPTPLLSGPSGHPTPSGLTRSVASGRMQQAPTPIARPIGQPVEPSPNASQIATLRKMRDEVATLGPVAPYESVRRIRQAWDQVARVKYSPAVSADYLAKQGEATGAAKGTGAMRESLAKTDPNSAQSYEAYSLYKAADDVVQAAEEANRVRPNRGRGMMARATGAIVGGREGGVPGAAIGAIAAGIADRAAEMAPTVQIAIARRLAAAADALRAGNPASAQQILERTVTRFPAVKSGLKITGKMTPAATRSAAGLPLAAQDDPNRR